MTPTGRSHRPHDLLWPADAAALTFAEPKPEWATPPWLSVAPVVVRRAVGADARRVPVGLRGATRGERCAAELCADRISGVVTPEALARRATMERATLRASPLPCLQALGALAPALDELPLAWGVTGGVGFTLASGFDVLRPDSDLDLLVHAPRADDADALGAIATLLRSCDASVDVQVETAAGAFALKEWLRTGGPVLLKTPSGPRLAPDAWSIVEAGHGSA